MVQQKRQRLGPIYGWTKFWHCVVTSILISQRDIVLIYLEFIINLEEWWYNFWQPEMKGIVNIDLYWSSIVHRNCSGVFKIMCRPKRCWLIWVSVGWDFITGILLLQRIYRGSNYSIVFHGNTARTLLVNTYSCLIMFTHSTYTFLVLHPTKFNLASWFQIDV
jgi:hypothetical protein